MEEPAGLVDSIYECAMLPELWPGVLDRLAAIAGARGGLLFAVNRRILNWTASDISRENMARFVGGDLIARSQRLGRIVGLNHAGFVRDNDHYTAEEMAQDPIYRDFLWPNGMGWAAATAIKVPTGDVVVLSLERERARGPVDLGAIPHLDALRPHIARSALLSARLQLERARVASETLALLGLPALVLDVGGRVVTANKAAEALDGYLRWGAQDRVAVRDAAANSLFRQAVASLGSNAGAPVRSFAIRGMEALPAMIAHLIPICGTARDLFMRCAAILVLMPVTMPQAPPVELVQSLFDLRPPRRALRVAWSLATRWPNCRPGRRVAPHGPNPGPWDLGQDRLRRQTEMVALLAGVTIPGC